MAVIAGTNEYRDRSGSHSRPTAVPSGTRRASPNTCWVQPPRSTGEPHRGVIATSRPQENLVPTLGDHALLNQQMLWTGIFFLLTTGTLYGFGVWGHTQHIPLAQQCGECHPQPRELRGVHLEPHPHLVILDARRRIGIQHQPEGTPAEF